MNRELVKEICIKPDGVYLKCKWERENTPYRLRKSDRLTVAYTQNGQKGLDVEFVKMLCWRFGEIRGNHPSVKRFNPCVSGAVKLNAEALTAIENKYRELGLTDEMLSEPDERLSDAAKAYQAFHRETTDKLFEQIANLAEPPTPNRNRDTGAR